jgi:hypothetical protein
MRRILFIHIPSSYIRGDLTCFKLYERPGVVFNFFFFPNKENPSYTSPCASRGEEFRLPS